MRDHQTARFNSLPNFPAIILWFYDRQEEDKHNVYSQEIAVHSSDLQTLPGSRCGIGTGVEIYNNIIITVTIVCKSQ